MRGDEEGTVFKLGAAAHAAAKLLAAAVLRKMLVRARTCAVPTQIH